ncbi:MAG: cell wall hydrolase [Candidatus Omnitrophota bacterium]|jgi:hypothetical protein
MGVFYLDRPENKPLAKFYLIAFLTLTLLLFAFFATAHAQATYPANLWQGLIAEDVAGGYQGMYAVACCVRNRLNAGLNTGLCGLKRKDLNAFVNRQPKKYQAIAKQIIKQVFEQNSPDVTGGGTHYEAVEKYGLPRWARGMIRTAKIGEHTFFKGR